MADSLKTLYLEKAVPKLKEQFGYTNPHQIPKLSKTTVDRYLRELR
ncbi:MAG: 50S ribosomal protein L5, partial [Cyanobacteria bacterium J06632_3]